MNVYDGKHWNIYTILPYQRNFNFINGERSMGKTYTTQYFILNKCIETNQEFVYIVRTQDEKKAGIFKSAFAKVIQNHFTDNEFVFTNDDMFLIRWNFELDIEEKIPLGYCVALTESIKIKKRSFPNVKYLIFDEYMLEESNNKAYINGWHEPDLFLSIYHTIDRESDRVICFLLGNNTKFYNPYHMHPAFSIPMIEKGEIWTSENVLFQNAKAQAELKDEKAQSKFVKMIAKSEYSNFAIKGEYIYDNFNFIEKISSSASYRFTLVYENQKYGIYADVKKGVIYISPKHDPNCKFSYALTIGDHKENTMFTKNKKNPHLVWLSNNFKNGNVRFTDIETKTKIERGIYLIL